MVNPVQPLSWSLYAVCLEFLPDKFLPDNNILASVGCLATDRVKTERNSESKARIKLKTPVILVK